MICEFRCLKLYYVLLYCFVYQIYLNTNNRSSWFLFFYMLRLVYVSNQNMSKTIPICPACQLRWETISYKKKWYLQQINPPAKRMRSELHLNISLQCMFWIGQVLFLFCVSRPGCHICNHNLCWVQKKQKNKKTKKKTKQSKNTNVKQKKTHKGQQNAKTTKTNLKNCKPKKTKNKTMWKKQE